MGSLPLLEFYRIGGVVDRVGENIRVTNSLKHDGPLLKVNGETTKGTLVPCAPAGETVDIDCET